MLKRVTEVRARKEELMASVRTKREKHTLRVRERCGRKMKRGR